MKTIKVTKPKVVMRLFWESQDLRYDKEDRKRYTKIKRVVNKIPVGTFKKIILNDRGYDFYRGFCYSQEIKEVLTDIEYDILQAVIDNIKIGYYCGGNYEDKEEEIHSKKRKWGILHR